MKTRYSLEKYSSGNRKQKVRCPKCNVDNKFVRYVDNATNEILNEKVGRCERINSCGYHYRPKQYFENNGIIPKYKPIKSKPLPPFFYVDKIHLNNSMQNNTKSTLYQFLIRYFDSENVKKTFNKYKVGYSERFGNSVVFWQVDNFDRIYTAKYMVYNHLTGKRDKLKFSWTKIPQNYRRRQCLFGLHLISLFSEDYKVGIVESEKTALICDLYFQDENIIWLATGGERFLNIEKLEPLKNRQVILFPDLTKENCKNTAFQFWENVGKKAVEKWNIDIKINQYLEKVSNEKQREEQQDLADFIINNM